MKLYIKSTSSNGYLYIFKHGIGPGTLPKDVNVIRWKDLPNHYTAVWLDRFLTTEEMDKYDIPYETEINKYLDRIGYCQKDGDVIPCDDVEACDNVTASIDSDINRYKKSLERKAAKSGVYENFGADEVRKLREKYRTLPDDDTDYFTAEHNSSSISSFENWCRNYVQSCDTKYFANMVNADTDTNIHKYYVAGYYDNAFRGLADSIETDNFSIALDKAYELACQGCNIKIENLLSDASAQYYSADEWLADIENGDVPYAVYQLV